MENRSFQKMAKKYSSVWIVLLCAIFQTCVFGYRDVSMASQSEEQTSNLPVQMEYYQYNVCASCHPEDDFFAVVSDTITPLKEEYPYEIMEARCRFRIAGYIQIIRISCLQILDQIQFCQMQWILCLRWS